MNADTFDEPSFDDPHSTSTQTQFVNPQNGGAVAPAAADVAKNLEPDTCRICRSEASAQEPLFYPCKCSGSIKYVHQDCLMEWLSHSQKKHCELCKTSFRFTKLYSPAMPKQLPVLVFARHLAKYFLRNILVWLRVVLVFFVWMVLLPALTRWEWSFFFWVSEEGLVAAPPRTLDGIDSNATSAAAAASSVALATAAATSAAAHIGRDLVNGSMAAARAPVADIYGVLDGNQTTPFSILSLAFRVIMESIRAPAIVSMLTADNGTEDDYFANTGPPTLLSDVAFLRRLTRFRWLNRWIIYALEGQFITFLVIICFILIILVRDYVLQQQPEINMRAAFNAADDDGMGGDENVAGVPGVPNAGQPQDAPRPARGDRARHHHHHHHRHNHHNQHGHDHDHDHDHDHGNHRDMDDAGFDSLESDSEWETDSNAEIEIDAAELLRPLVQGPERNGLDLGAIFDDDFRHGPPVPDTDGLAARDEPGESSSSSANVHTSANANAMSSTASNSNGNSKSKSKSNSAAALPNFDRNFPLPSEGGATVHEYMQIYRRAGGDQQRILEIAREEGLEEHLQYWLRVMQNVADRRQSDRGSTASTISTTAAADEDTRRVGEASRHRDGQPANGEASNSSSVTEFDYGLRPRANTDGPSGPPRTNPLGNNNWSFGPVPPTQHFTPEFIQPLYGDSAERLDGVPIRGDAPSHQRVTEPREGDLRLEGEQRRRSVSSAASSRRNSNASASSRNGTMANISQDAAASSASAHHAHDSSSTEVSAAIASPPSTDLSQRNDPDAPLRQTGNWEELVRIPIRDNIDEGDATDFEDMPAAGLRHANINGAPREQAPAAAGPVAGPATLPFDAAAPDAALAAPATVPAAPAAPAATADSAGPPASLVDGVMNFMWRDLENIDPADLPPIVPDVDEDDHVELFNDNEEDGPIPLDEQDREAFEAAAAAAAAANMEAEAIEDAEDLEGVMELLGMRGPIAGLFQNVIFCGFLVSVSLLVGIFMPYNVGRLSIWLVANPMRPIMMLFSLSKLLQDIAASALGGAAYLTLLVLNNAASAAELVFGRTVPYSKYILASLATTWDLCATSAARVVENFSIDPPFLSTGEIRNFSAISHDALIGIKANVSAVATGIGRAIVMVTNGEFLSHGTEALELAKSGGAAAWELLRSLPAVLSNPGSWVITLDSMDAVQVNPMLAFWGGVDRGLAILFGYATMCLVAGLYLHRGSPFSSGAAVQEWEASLIDGLNQASGVLKVILIIGIEMLVFPLYCGLLLDVALLPLFENTTLVSRLQFSVDYPLTAIFVHWFVGTGYMFHFALFVSMCRKIMRKGVLYFIRDPDDPEFHPVRDVLERTVATQLCKILLSAFVYGALVIICLGGVVWGLAYAGPGILPIHYSSNEPVLEFPIDLLFYNFLMPLAIKFFRPSDGLHSMYTWWFRKSARGLRITWFLFGERRIDEEGSLYLASESPHQKSPWLVRQLLEYDESKNTVVPMATMSAKPSKGVYDDGENDRTSSNPNRPPRASPVRRRNPDKDSMRFLADKKLKLVASGQLVPNGKFVRAPASDQVKIPKNKDVFLDASNEASLSKELGEPARKDPFRGPDRRSRASDADDNRPEQRPADIYHSKQYELVYIPPFFRVRIFLFIASIWMFAAVTGVSCTIIPLLFGRRLFRLLLPADVRTNDIYAFSIGMYVLGSASYFVFHARPIFKKMWAATRRTMSTASVRSAAQTTWRAVTRILSLVYAYVFILVVFPLLATALVELYLLMPLHTYMHPPGSSSISAASPSDGTESRHNVRIIQSWTLGLLYLKVSARVITTWYPGARLTSAIRAVLRRGNLDPDVRLLTRAFVVPGLVLGATTIGLPLLLAKGYVAASASLDIGGLSAPAALQFVLPVTVPEPAVADMRLVYRLAFPFVALVGLAAWSLWGMVGVYASWKLRIRDEAYLIGERLHNFGATNGAQAPTRRVGVGRAAAARA
ncbi:hypothetical protein SPBR_04539 [Sporothrix brasiliensis 5110]|uniref:RING-type E3 ubiquitin transferase n=1 Tax=Sporothrix brasiliensis 5110 TaxID=1398154 RepID=A0A0C2ENX0_9PEZI|nr:uncharacterized protein SPBR_04539 [Sporothrix brasiliensis 5110]KIH87834.1 hypothetical protein SPBR_04539 [Sporothrix brasiliensis 5110]